MNTDKSILLTIAALEKEGNFAALATVVGVTGSSYRREGAKMLVLNDGGLIGAISGGCLEADVREVGLELIETGRPRLLRYDNTSDDDTVWGLGLGCNGVVEVFVERVPDNDSSVKNQKGGNNFNLYSRIENVSKNGDPVIIATVIKSEDSDDIKEGAKVIVHQNGTYEGSLGDETLDSLVKNESLERLKRNSVNGDLSKNAPFNRIKDFGNTKAYLDMILPLPHLYVFGAGPDAVPLVNMAEGLGFYVTLVDHRPGYVKKKEFSLADEFITAKPSEIGKKFKLDPGSFVVILTHNFKRDRDIFSAILNSKPAYIGQLGPKVRTDKILKELKENGVILKKGALDYLRSPAGLDIGAETPEEIALSIMSEIMAVRSGSEARPLITRKGPIHERNE